MTALDSHVRENGLLIVLSGPSGVGKDAVLDELSKVVPSLRRCVTATTRAPRVGEVDGIDYTFLTRDDFQRRINEGDFLEYAEFCGNLYGTPKKWVEHMLREGVDVILKIEVQGGLAVKKQMPSALMVFLVPPSIEELERRLRGRGTDSDCEISGRLARALKELEEIPNYDYLIVNDTVANAAETLKAVIVAEHCRIQ